MDVIGEYSGISAKRIGQISICETFSFFEVPRRYAKQVIADLCGTTYNQRTITVELAGAAQPARAKKSSRKNHPPKGTHAGNRPVARIAPQAHRE
jgi:DbpA RNA binding domain.